MLLPPDGVLPLISAGSPFEQKAATDGAVITLLVGGVNIEMVTTLLFTGVVHTPETTVRR